MWLAVLAVGGCALTERASHVLRAARDANIGRGAFSVVSHNILAPIYATPGTFGVSAEVLDWPRRRDRLCQELAACDSDVVMLQEVQLSTFSPDFDALCASCGYAASLQADQVRRPYANAILYRAARYEPVLEESRSRAQILVLRERAQAAPAAEPDEGAGLVRLLYLANVHLQKGGSEQLTRLTQLRSLFKRLALHREEQGALHARAARADRPRSGGAARAAAAALLESSVIGGDFNSARQSSVYELMRDSGLSRFPATTRRPGGTPGGGVRAYRTGFLGVRDVYQARQPRWGPYSMSHCTRTLLDYIWASTDLEVVETMPRSQERAHAALFPEAAHGQRAAEAGPLADGAEQEPVLRGGRICLPSADGAYASDHLPSGCVLAPRAGWAS